MCVRAKAMLSVPSVTMKGGRRRQGTRKQLRRPNDIHRPMPRAMARNGLRWYVTASLVMTIVPNAITAPLERSTPAVRMIRVWPMARIPTTATCWVISDRFSVVRNRSVRMVKKIEARRSAISGPSDEIRRARARAAPASPPAWVPRKRGKKSRSALTERTGRFGFRRLAPAVGEAVGRVLRVDATDGLVADERHAGGGVAGYTLAIPGQVN